MRSRIISRSLQKALLSATMGSMPTALKQMNLALRKVWSLTPRKPPGGLAMTRGAHAAAAPAANDDVASAAPAQAGGQFLNRKFSGEAGARDYKLYVPKSYAGQPLPMVLMLHGCHQNPVDFARGTQMNALADQRGFFVIYPEQPANANGGNCWNWFDARHQMRGLGEAAILAALVQEVSRSYPTIDSQVFVAGLSAGAAMAVILGVTYPEVFSAVGAHSGLPYGAATDIPSAFAAMKGRAANRSKSVQSVATEKTLADVHHSPRVIVFHGDADETVAPSNATEIVDAARLSLVSDLGSLTQSKLELVEAGGRRASLTRFVDPTGRPAIEDWLIHGAGHAWSGGDAKGSYTSTEGPSASKEMVRFFMS